MEVDEKELIKLSTQMGLSHHGKGNIFFKYGDIGDHFYIIIKGKVKVLLPNEKKRETAHELRLELENV